MHRRPALILSPRVYNSKPRLAIACPIASHVKHYPFEVPLPRGGTITGVVLADHVKNLDWQARKVVFDVGDTILPERGRLDSLLRLAPSRVNGYRWHLYSAGNMSGRK